MYVIDSSNSLHALSETAYDKEVDLQALVARHPALLGGDQMNRANPRNFLLIASEAGIGLSETSGALFSLDLLFVDQDGIPTLVEVKRSSDTRIRREVVAQLLEYAANFSISWTADRIRATFEDRCHKENLSPSEAALALAVTPEQFSYEQLWGLVATNLSDGILRLVVLADDIPLTTLHILEYLNGQMNKTEVFAVKVSQHVGGATRILSTHILNASQESAERKTLARGNGRGELWTRERFFDHLQERCGPNARKLFEEVTGWAEGQTNIVPFYGRGFKDGSIQITAVKNVPNYNNDTDVVFLTLWSLGRAEICFEYLAKKPPFDSPDLREELRSLLNAITGISIAEDQTRRRPSLSWDILRSEDVLPRVLQTQEWVMDQFRVAWKSTGLLNVNAAEDVSLPR